MGTALCLPLPFFAAAQISVQTIPGGPSGEAISQILGTWGTADQCAQRSPADEHVSTQPYQISRQWLRRGFLYCLIHWTDNRRLKDGSQSADVFLQCGEDTVREYGASFTLKDRHLTISWSGGYRAGPLQECTPER